MVQLHRQTFIVRHCRVRRALQGHQQGGVLQPRLQCLLHPGPFWASHMCLQQEQHNSQQRHQQEQHQRGEGETQNCIQREDTVATHSNLNQVIVINWQSSCDDRIQQVGSNQSTAKKAPFCFFFEELKKAGGSYSPVWICVGCHPAGYAALTLYEHVYVGQ